MLRMALAPCAPFNVTNDFMVQRSTPGAALTWRAPA